MYDVTTAERILRFTKAERMACNKAVKALLAVGYDYAMALHIVLDSRRFQARDSFVSGDAGRADFFHVKAK